MRTTPPSPGSFTLHAGNATAHLRRRGLVAKGVSLQAVELAGGVSATVVAVRGPGVSVVVKQALARLRVQDDWRAKQERTAIEAAAMRLCARLTPGRVPRVIDHDPATQTMVMELLPDEARNWQAEIAAGRVHAQAGTWAGQTVGVWHASTAGDLSVAQTLADFESFEQQRLRPFYETAMERRPELAAGIAPRLAELRSERRCLVHGDYAKKNMLVGPPGKWVLDFEVAHYGNPVFDLAFFLSFVVLSAIRWPSLLGELRQLADGFLSAYATAAGEGFAGDAESVTSHTACLILARTDGKSPALFFDPPSRERAREVGIDLLRAPGRGLWSWA